MPDVDSDMVGTHVAGRVVPTHQVTHPQVVQTDTSAGSSLLCRDPGQVHTHVLVDVLDEPGTVETLRRGATPHIRGAQELACILHHLPAPSLTASTAPGSTRATTRQPTLAGE